MRRIVVSGTRPFGLLILLGLAGVAPLVSAAVPEEVSSMGWCPSARDCLSWSTAEGATAYQLHRGAADGLPSLVTAAVDSCAVDLYSTTTTGPTIGETPNPWGLHWYLVVGTDGEERGSAGVSSSGPRSLDGSGPCTTAGGLVINEVDYDQPGIDSSEFVELVNRGSAPRSLDGVILVFVNGTTSAEYGRIDLGVAGVTLESGGYLVVGTSNVVGSVPPGTPTVLLPSSSNNLQNGAPDGIALYDTARQQLLDAISYEGAMVDATIDGVSGLLNLVAGTATAAQDSSTQVGSLSRVPDGIDTGNDFDDWRFVSLPTPGSINLP